MDIKHIVTLPDEDTFKTQVNLLKVIEYLKKINKDKVTLAQLKCKGLNSCQYLALKASYLIFADSLSPVNQFRLMNHRQRFIRS